jgi:predicted HD phosphohydrolase
VNLFGVHGILNPVFIDLDKTSQRTIVSFFDIIRKQACREFFHPPMILDAFTAHSFAAAGFIAAVAEFHVLILPAFGHI